MANVDPISQQVTAGGVLEFAIETVAGTASSLWTVS